MKMYLPDENLSKNFLCKIEKKTQNIRSKPSFHIKNKEKNEQILNKICIVKCEGK